MMYQSTIHRFTKEALDRYRAFLNRLLPPTAQLPDLHSKPLNTLASGLHWINRLDVAAGRLVGADHLRKNGVDGFSYALSMGASVVLVGFTVALLELMLVIVSSLNNFPATWIASVGVGLAMLLIARSLYPNVGFQGAFVVLTGIAAPVSFGAAMYGYDFNTIFNALMPAFGAALGMLVSFQLMFFIMDAIASAFKKQPKQLPAYPPTMRQIRKAGLLTPEEIAQVKVFNHRVYIMIAAWLVLPLLVGLAVGTLSRDVVLGVVFFGFSFLLLIPILIRVDRPTDYHRGVFKRDVVARLESAGLLQLVERSETVTITIESKGYMLGDQYVPLTGV